MMETVDEKCFDLRTQIPNFSIDASIRETLSFTENLLICHKNEFSTFITDTKPIGGYCISINKIGPESKEFLVNVAASMKIDGGFADGGSKLVGTVNENFQCLEEKRTEFLNKTCAGQYEKCLYIGSEDDSYCINVRTNCPCGDSTFSSHDITMKSHSRLISEAGNILLMRYLALTNFHGSLILESMTIDGIIEACDYKCTSANRKKLDGRCLEVYTVERRTRGSVEGIIRESKTLLTRQGRILRHEWLELSYVLRINPLVDPLTIERKYADTNRPLRETWLNDIELMSKYLDKKTCGVARQKNYFADHPEIKSLLSDYTQTLLIVQPVDVIGFTIQHFKAFALRPE